MLGTWLRELNTEKRKRGWKSLSCLGVSVPTPWQGRDVPRAAPGDSPKLLVRALFSKRCPSPRCEELVRHFELLELRPRTLSPLWHLTKTFKQKIKGMVLRAARASLRKRLNVVWGREERREQIHRAASLLESFHWQRTSLTFVLQAGNSVVCVCRRIYSL